MTWKSRKISKPKSRARSRMPGTIQDKPSLVGEDPKDYSGKVPSVDWNKNDVQILGPWTEQSVREFTKARKDVPIYRAMVPISDLDEHLAEEDRPNGDEDENPSEWPGYDWSDYRRNNSFPPIVVMRTESGEIKMVDGNHRVHYWRQIGYELAPAWVVDELIADYQKSHGLKRLRIVQKSPGTIQENLARFKLTGTALDRAPSTVMAPDGTIYGLTTRSKKPYDMFDYTWDHKKLGLKANVPMESIESFGFIRMFRASKSGYFANSISVIVPSDITPEQVDSLKTYLARYPGYKFKAWGKGAKETDEKLRELLGEP